MKKTAKIKFLKSSKEMAVIILQSDVRLSSQEDGTSVILPAHLQLPKIKSKAFEVKKHSKSLLFVGIKPDELVNIIGTDKNKTSTIISMIDHLKELGKDAMPCKYSDPLKRIDNLKGQLRQAVA